MSARAAVYEAAGHRAVQGWIEPQILAVVRELSAAQHDGGVIGPLVEVGVHHGRLFVGMYLHRRSGETAVAVDLYELQAGNVDASGLGDRERFLANLRRWAGGDDGVEVLTADSTTLTPSDLLARAGAPARLFSVDGGHTADIVESDMRLAEACVRPGAVVLGDDVFNEQWPGAHDGTTRYLSGDPGLVPFAIGFNKTMFTDSAHVQTYRDVLRALARRRLWFQKDSEMAGYPVTIVWKPAVEPRVRMAGRRLLGPR